MGGGGAVLLVVAGTSHNTFAGMAAAPKLKVYHLEHGLAAPFIDLPAICTAHCLRLRLRGRLSLFLRARPEVNYTFKAGPGVNHKLPWLPASGSPPLADPLALFGQQLGWVLEKLGLASHLDPVLGIHLTTIAALAFLSQHLPLSPEQREMQVCGPLL